jgi:hypothetical protein
MRDNVVNIVHERIKRMARKSIARHPTKANLSWMIPALENPQEYLELDPTINEYGLPISAEELK